MSSTCLHNGHLAALVFGAIFGTLVLTVVFIVLLWYFYLRHLQIGNKVFYVDRKTVEDGQCDNTSTNKLDQPDNVAECKPNPASAGESRQFVHNGGHSTYKEENNDFGSAKLSDLGITINKGAGREFQVESVQNAESKFLPGDKLTHISVDLEQLPLEKAAAVLELLAPFRVKMEVLRQSQSGLEVEAEVEPEPRQAESAELAQESEREVAKAETVDEKVETVEEIQKTKVEDSVDIANNNDSTVLAPPLPCSPPPASPSSQRHSQCSTKSDDSEPRPRPLSKIPTPKSSSRGLSRPLETKTETPDSLSYAYQDIKFGQMNGCNNNDVLVVSNEETDEFGLTTEQYNTLENNRRRLERERQQLRDLGILS